MTITKESLWEAFDDIHTFNDIGSGFVGDLENNIDSQLSVCFEELSETITAFENRDEKELLDGAVDMFVTGIGLLQKLEAAGFDVDKAIWKVCKNNLTKFPTNDELTLKTAAANPDWKRLWNCDYRRYVFKDQNGKIRKPINYKPVDLSDCLPFTGLFKE